MAGRPPKSWRRRAAGCLPECLLGPSLLGEEVVVVAVAGKEDDARVGLLQEARHGHAPDGEPGEGSDVCRESE